MLNGLAVKARGAPLETARAAAILLHGRGGTAEDILGFSRELAAPGLAFLAPQAEENTWYPYSFLSPLALNEPDLSNALNTLDRIVNHAVHEGVPAERILLLGFSQGACLALEYAARHARRYGAVAGLSGGLIGPEGTPRDYPGSLDGTPVFLGCSDHDPHIPRARVEETASVLNRLGALVTLKLYPEMEHTINADEVRHVQTLLAALTPPEDAA